MIHVCALHQNLLKPDQNNDTLWHLLLCQNDNNIQMICETTDILKSCCLIYTYNINVQGRKNNLLALPYKVGLD